jgi:N-acetylgalactosamine kinase
LITNINDLYLEPETLKEKKEFINKNYKTFEKEFGKQPESLARAPGRVNIIGEHIDYNGYGVFPFAIHKEIFMLFSENNLNKIRMRNSLSDKFAGEDFDLLSENWNPVGGNWTGYILWGFRAILSLSKTQFDISNFSKGFDILVFSDLPMACGVSSSSALSVCSCLVGMKMLELDSQLQRIDVVTSIIEFERMNGLKSGGMDQTASVFGENNKALQIEFKPKLHHQLFDMTGFSFVLCNSHTQSVKVETGHKRYNKRFFECKMGLCILIKQYLKSLDTAEDTIKQQYLQIETIADLEKIYAEKGDFIKFANEVFETEALNKKTFSIEELYELLGIQSYEEIFGKDDLIQKVIEFNSEFNVRDRVKHVLLEKQRVYQYCKLLQDQDDNRESECGKLMNCSQKSCSELYECSSSNLDELTMKSLQFGAIGSRLTGAGWGGCYICLVPTDKVR